MLVHANIVVVPAVLRKGIVKKFYCGIPGDFNNKISNEKLCTLVYYATWYWTIGGIVQFWYNSNVTIVEIPIGKDYLWSRFHIGFAGWVQGTYYQIIGEIYTSWIETATGLNTWSAWSCQLIQRPLYEFSNTQGVSLEF